MSPSPIAPQLNPNRSRQGGTDVIFVGDDWAEDHHDVFVCDR